ncbi:MAG: peptide chain release factor N(5)-glutamine methyltransferase [Chloroflexota bacterium]
MVEDADSDSIGQWIKRAQHQLSRAGIPSPADEARLFMAEVLNVSTAWVLAHPEAIIPPDRKLQFQDYLNRRSAHEPVAYILGHKEFFGLDFDVSPAVLIPRPETELLVEKALAAADRLIKLKRRSLLAVDLGTGSGAVAVALAVNQPNMKLIAVDNSGPALHLAKTNAYRHGVNDRIDFRRGDLLHPVSEQFDLLVANLPYIPSSEVPKLMVDVSRYEPHEALDGGPDGTSLIRRALEQAKTGLEPPAALLFEIGDGQGDELAAFARRIYPDATVDVARDYAGFERILSIMANNKRADIVEWPENPAEQRALIKRAADLLRAGEVVAFPTDTVYGIAAESRNDEAVRRLYSIKERPAHKAIALLIAGASQLPAITDCQSPALETLARTFWPGGLTIVVPWLPEIRIAGEKPLPTVGVRVPNHPIALAIIEEVGTPLATTSANLSGAPSAVTAREVAQQIGDRIALIIDGGPCPGGIDSTVVDITTDPPIVRRIGAVSVEQLEKLLGRIDVVR